MIAGLVLLASLAADPGAGAGPAVQGAGCPVLNAPRAARILAIEMRATGKPWSALVVGVACGGDDFTIKIVDTAGGRNLEQGLFADAAADGATDRERWLARVLVDLVVELWGVPDPRPPAGGAPTPTSQATAAMPAARAPGAARAPTFTEWLGPHHAGIRAAWRWFDLERPLPVAQFGIQMARPISAHLAPFIAINIATGDGKPRGADVNTVAFQIAGGLTVGTSFHRPWTIEAEAGATMMRNRITLREPGTGTQIAQRSGFAAAADLAILVARRTGGSRIGLGIASGLVFGAPENAIPTDPAAEPVSINGVSLGAFLHIGSAVSARPAD